MNELRQMAHFGSSAFTKDIANGVEAYWAEHQECRGYILGAARPEILELETIHGMISMVTKDTEFLVDESRLRGFQLVNTSNQMLSRYSPSVISDDVEVGRVAARYLLEQGYTDFIYVHNPMAKFSFERAEGFREIVQEKGFALAALDYPGVQKPRPKPSEFELAQKALVQRCLETVAARSDRAVFCNTSETLAHLLRICRRHFPDDLDRIGWMGVDAPGGNLFEVHGLQITAVRPDFHRVGYEAAALLRRIMSGEAVPADPILIPPIGVVQGDTTPGAVKGDPMVAKALRWIDAHLQEGSPVSVQALADELHCSPRTLQRRFQDCLGVGVKEEIVNRRMLRAKELLRTSDKSITEIALHVGYHSHSEFSRRFHAAHALSPRLWRQQNRS